MNFYFVFIPFPAIIFLCQKLSFMKKLILILCSAFLSSVISAQEQGKKVWTLEECINYALQKNIQVRKSEVANRQYQISAGQVKAQRYPNLNASINQNFNWSKSNADLNSGFSGNNGSTYSVNSNVVLYNGLKLANEIRQSELNVEAGKYSLETTKESISLSILNAYLQVLYAEEQVRNSEKQIESTASQVNLAAERLAMQVISQADYAQIKSQLASEKLTLANAQNTLAINKVNLEQLMELPVNEDFSIAHPDLSGIINQNRVPDVSTVYDTALSIKPQIKNAAINKDIASIDEKIARSGYFPVLSASAGVGSSFAGSVSDPYFNQLNNGLKPSLGFSLSIPIYQKNQVKSGVELAKLGYTDAELSELDTRNALRKSIEQACQDVSSAQIRYEASLENFNATNESAALSDEKFIQGVINSTDYLVSKTNLIVAESELLQSKFNLIFSYKVLDFYMGIPLSI